MTLPYKAFLVLICFCALCRLSCLVAYSSNNCLKNFNTENCTNGIDDDGDGYVDCFDTDCDCNEEDCVITEIDQDFSVKLSWQSTVDMVAINAVPIVADLNPLVDSIPEIIATTTSTNVTSVLSADLLFFKGDGTNAANPKVLPITNGYDNYPAMHPVVGDVNSDGIPEVLMVSSDRRIRVYTDYDENANPPMQELIVSSDLVANRDIKPYLADFDQDGTPEVYAGNDIFQFDFTNNTLTRVLDGDGPFGVLSFNNDQQPSSSPVAVDILNPADCNGDPDCNGLELVAGSVIYSIDLSTTDGDGVEIKIKRDLEIMEAGDTFRDGYTVVADVNLDGLLDVIVSSRINFTYGIYVWDKNGLLEFFPHPIGSIKSGGLPCVANVYDDTQDGFSSDFPEIIVCSETRLNCYNLNAATIGINPYWWSLATTDDSGLTGCTAFDFNGDDIYEIVYRDEDNLRIMYGGAAPFPTGVDNVRNWATFTTGSGTFDEYPIVADLDNDRQAEIAVTGYTFAGVNSPPGNYRGRLRIFETDSDPWMSSRAIWNQYAYFGVNINDDLTIPQEQQLHHLEFPTAGSDHRPFNNYITQIPLLNDDYESYLPVADATLTIDSFYCFNGNAVVEIEFCNIGDNTLPENLPVTFYDADPTSTTANVINTISLFEELRADQCVIGTFVVPLMQNQNNSIFVVVNDNASLVSPYDLSSDFSITDIVECDYTNNIQSFDTNFNTPVVDLGQDEIICANQTVELNAGSGFMNYEWQDGSSDSIFIANTEGLFWVEVRDDCGNAQRDSISISIENTIVLDIGTDTSICENTSLVISLDGFDTYNWSPSISVDCDTCSTVDLSPTMTTTYTVEALTVDGCIAEGTIVVDIAQNYTTQIDTSICQGESLQYDDVTIPIGESNTFLYSSVTGCDSTIVVSVNALDTFYQTIDTTICTGEVLIFDGEALTIGMSNPFVYTSSLGCDSTIVVNVQAPDSDVYLLEIDTLVCQGESLLFNGVTISSGESSTFSYSTIAGCDSTIVVSVNALDTFYQILDTTVCTGEIFLYNGEELTAGMSTTVDFISSMGCDSTVQVNVMASDSDAYLLEIDTFICQGETLLFNEVLIPTGESNTFSYTTIGGCDSTIVVSVNALDTFYQAIDTTICTGDILLYNGEELTVGMSTSVLYTSSMGCDSTVQVNVLAPDSDIYLLEIDTFLCQGENFIFDGVPIPTGESNTFSYMTVAGCDSTIIITVNSLDTFYQVLDTIVCSGDIVEFDGEMIEADSSMTFTYSSINNCDSTVVVNVIGEGQSTFQQIDTVVCAGESILFNGEIIEAGNDFTFYYQLGPCDSTIVVNTIEAEIVQTSESIQICAENTALIFGNMESETGIFEQTFAASNGCDSTHTIDLSVLSPIDIVLDVEASCEGGEEGSISAFVSGSLPPYNYEWSDGSTNSSLENLPSGAYQLTVTDAFGCFVPSAINVPSLSSSTATINGVAVSCFGENDGMIQIETVDSTLLFSLDGENFTSVMEYNYLEAGMYEVAVQDANGCVSMQEVIVDSPIDLDVNLPEDLTIALGDSVEILAAVNSFDSLSYEWSPTVDCLGCPVQTLQPFTSTEYSVTVTNGNNCTAEDELFIFVNNDRNIYIPNAFSPNGDGFNDLFVINAGSGIKGILSFVIFDRWGEQVFEATNFLPNDPTYGWDGVFKNKVMNNAVFVYVAEVEFVDGERILYKGDLILFR